jgi:hypothetical protein
MRFITWSGTGPGTGNRYNNEPGFVFEEAVDPTVTIRGAASDLDLFLWGRGATDRLAVEGNEELVHRLRRIAADATR